LCLIFSLDEEGAIREDQYSLLTTIERFCMSDRARVTTTFQLLHGHATSLRSEQGGVLRVTGGRLYVTTGQSPEDYFLETGDTLDIPSNAHVVLETWNQNKVGSAKFEWLEELLMVA
jgi:hypothetical protein